MKIKGHILKYASGKTLRPASWKTLQCLGPQKQTCPILPSSLLPSFLLFHKTNLGIWLILFPTNYSYFHTNARYVNRDFPRNLHLLISSILKIDKTKLTNLFFLINFQDIWYFAFGFTRRFRMVCLGFLCKSFRGGSSDF